MEKRKKKDLIFLIVKNPTVHIVHCMCRHLKAYSNIWKLISRKRLGSHLYAVQFMLYAVTMKCMQYQSCIWCTSFHNSFYFPIHVGLRDFITI